MSSKVFYVYAHKDPDTGEVVYVGSGSLGRAWDVSRNRSGNTEHRDWLLSLSDRGYLPTDWVEVLHKGLSQSEARDMEHSYLHKDGVTRFNRQCGERQHQSKLTNEQAVEIFKLSWSGKMSRGEIAEKYGICPSNVSMIKHKKQWKSVLANEETNVR